MRKQIALMSDQDLANEWRKGVDKNYAIVQQLIDRGYSFRCMKHGSRLDFHASSDIEISKQEIIKL